MTILLRPSGLKDLMEGQDVVFEIGFGNGDFLLYLRRQYPEALLVGAEVANKYFLIAHRKLEREGIRNFALYRGDGRTLLYFFAPDNSIDAIYINFPDPWEKPSKESKRLVSADSIKVYYSRLKRKGHLFITTDSDLLKDYLRRTLNNLNVPFTESLVSPFGDFLTKYGRKWLSLNKPISYFIIEKQDDSFFDLSGSCESFMPNFIFYVREEVDCELERIGKIIPLEHKEGDFFYKIDKIYRSPDGEVLFRVIHSEPFLNQKYYIVFRIFEGKGYMEIDDKNGLIISRSVIKTFRDLALRIFRECGKEMIFKNFGEV